MMLNHLAHFARGWNRHWVLQMATLTVLSAVFSVVSLAFVAHQNVNLLMSHWGDSIKMSLFLKEEASPVDLEKLKNAIDENEKSFSYKFISKEEAIDNFQKSSANNLPKFIFDKNFGNPLPPSYELSFSKGTGGFDYEKLVNFASLFKNFSAVEDVAYGQGWIENFAQVFKQIKISSWMIVGILLLGSLFVVANSIGNSINQRRDEVEILELIGATSSYIRGPYIFEGIAIGIIAAVIGLVISFGVYSWQTHMLQQSSQVFSVSSIQFLSLVRQICVVIMGGFFGFLGSYISIKKVGTGWAAASSEG